MDEELNIIEKIPSQFRLQMCLIKVSDNDFFSIGNFHPYNNSFYTKYNLDGVILNSAACSELSDSVFQYRMYRLNGNNVSAIGTNAGSSFKYAALSKFDLGGEIEYCKSYDLSYFSSLANDESLEYIYAMGNENTNCRIYKLDYAGNQVSVFSLNDSLYGNNIIYNSGSLFIAGYSNPVGSNPGARFIKLNVDSVFSIAEDIANKRINVYPNPAGNYVEFNVKSIKFKVAELRLYDVFGRQAASKQITSEQTVLDVSGLPAGVYFYRVALEGGMYSGKLVIQR